MPEKTAWHITRGEVTRVQQRPARRPPLTRIAMSDGDVMTVALPFLGPLPRRDPRPCSCSAGSSSSNTSVARSLTLTDRRPLGLAYFLRKKSGL